jgi:energy-coupling factor transport system permease protein
LAAAILVISALYSAAFVHAGDTILFRLPPWPLIGGPWTAEAVAAGLTNGLVLLSVMAVFLALNSVVTSSDLIRLAPSSLRDLGLVLLIAVNYVPETRRQLALIRDAQAIRGHRLRGLRDWRPVVIPLLEGGLERAMRLAEAMVARGFGAPDGVARSARQRLALAASVLLATAGWLLLLVGHKAGWLAVVAGLAALAAVAWRSGRRRRRTIYGPQRFTWHDVLTLLASALPILVILGTGQNAPEGSLVYNPFPRLAWPPFDAAHGLALAGLALPALVWQWQRPSRSRATA